MTLADRIDRALARPPVGAAILAVIGAVHVVSGTDIANVMISYLTLAVALSLAGSQRRDRLGVHAKLDELIHAVAGARDDLERIEDSDEAEIERVRGGLA